MMMVKKSAPRTGSRHPLPAVMKVARVVAFLSLLACVLFTSIAAAKVSEKVNGRDDSASQEDIWRPLPHDPQTIAGICLATLFIGE